MNGEFVNLASPVEITPAYRAPGISLIIPCYNGAQELEACLAALAAFPIEDMECIVIDDASTDGTAAVAQQARIPVQLIRFQKRRGAAAARNAGARHASGGILVFLDADVCIHSETLPLIVAAFAEAPGLGALIGSYDHAPSAAGFHSQYRNLLHCYVHRTGRKRACTFWTGCGAVRRSVFFQHGEFDESPRCIDDVEFGGRLFRAGVRIDLRPDVQVTHTKRWTLLSCIQTDIWLRGIPWTALILREGRIPNTLNLDYRNRLSVASVWLAFLISIAACSHPSFVFLLPLPVLLTVYANRGLYRFFDSRGGANFALQSAAAHFLHLFNCGLSFLLGILIFAIFTSAPPPNQKVSPRSLPLEVVNE